MRLARWIVVLETIDARVVRVASCVHQCPRGRTAGVLVKRVDERRAHLRQLINVRRENMSQWAVRCSMTHLIEGDNGVNALIVSQDPEDIWLVARKYASIDRQP